MLVRNDQHARSTVEYSVLFTRMRTVKRPVQVIPDLPLMGRSSAMHSHHLRKTKGRILESLPHKFLSNPQ